MPINLGPEQINTSSIRIILSISEYSGIFDSLQHWLLPQNVDQHNYLFKLTYELYTLIFFSSSQFVLRLDCLQKEVIPMELLSLCIITILFITSLRGQHWAPRNLMSWARYKIVTICETLIGICLFYGRTFNLSLVSIAFILHAIR